MIFPAVLALQANFISDSNQLGEHSKQYAKYVDSDYAQYEHDQESPYPEWINHESSHLNNNQDYSPESQYNQGYNPELSNNYEKQSIKYTYYNQDEEFSKYEKFHFGPSNYEDGVENVSLLNEKFTKLKANPSSSNFYVSPQKVTLNTIVQVSDQPNLVFKWTWDTCAGRTDSGGNVVANVVKTSSGCVTPNGDPTFAANGANIYPQGFSTLQLVPAYGGSAIDLLPFVPNSNTLVGVTQQASIDITNIVSGYYYIAMSATDSNGSPVAGKSFVFIVKNVQDLPNIQNLVLYSPLKASYWSANTTYSIRFGLNVLNGYIPDQYYVDILDENNNIIQAKAIGPSYPFANDTLFGPSKPVNYTRWHIGTDYVNKKLKIRLTGVQVQGTNVVELPDPPRRLFRFATGFEIALNIFAVIMAIVAGAVTPMTTVVFGDMVDTFSKWNVQPFIGALLTAEQLQNEINDHVYYFCIFAAIIFVGTFLYMILFIYTSEHSSQRIRKTYLQAVLSQEISFFDKVGAGEITTRVSSDTLFIKEGMSEKFPIIVASVAALISGLVVAFVKSWKLTLLMLAIVPFFLASTAAQGIFTNKFQTRISDLYSKSGVIAEEVFTAIRTVVSLNAQQKVSKIYSEGLVQAKEEGIKKAKAVGAAQSGFYLFFFLCYGSTFWYASSLIARDEISVGNMLTIVLAVMTAVFGLGQIAPNLSSISQARAAAFKIFATIDRTPLINSLDTSGYVLEKEKVNGSIELSNIHFTYPSRPERKILDNFSLKIKAGTSVALVGQSGSGKSTIVQLLERFYDPDSGNILLDGRDLKSINVASLRQSFAIVSQEPVLFDGTILENVAFGLAGTPMESESPKVIEKLVIKACKEANATEFIDILPNRYNTAVGERGMLLSGGQKQRIAIARAIIKDPKILLLDEATSALDSQSERLVQEALEAASKSRTTITVAHRLSTIVNSDKIVVMALGEIKEMGTHQELLSLDGLYSKLVKLQVVDGGHDKDTFMNTDGTVLDVTLGRNATVNDKTVSRKNSKKADLEGQTENAGYTRSQAFAALMKISSTEMNYIIPAAVFSVLVGLINPYFSYSYANLVTDFSSGVDLNAKGIHWALVFYGCGATSFTACFLYNSLFGTSGEILVERLRSKIFTKLVKQDISFYDREENTIGVLTSKLSTNAQLVLGATGVPLGGLGQLLSCVVVSILISFFSGWKLTLVAVSLLPFLILNIVARFLVAGYLTEKNKNAYQISAKIANEAVAAIKTVQSLTREEAIVERYATVMNETLQNGLNSAVISSLVFAFSEASVFAIYALVFYYGGHLLAYEGYTLNSFFTVFIEIIFGAKAMGVASAQLPDFIKGLDAAKELLNLLDEQVAIDVDAGGKKIDMKEGRIEFRDVKFHYPTRPNNQILKGISLEIKQGQFAAFVGSSGCGKSTMLQMVERFYDPTSGRITIDGNLLVDLDVLAYRNQVSLVSQEPNLFNASIRENIALGLDYVPSQEELDEACKKANIYEYIMSLSDKYETQVGFKGSQLSGGQKQRIAIARALIRNPKILLLDEATSALDAVSEKVVQEALDAAAKGRTTIAIAHRLSSIQNADVIYVFDEGKVIEKGIHAELYAKKGAYYKLAIHQNLE
ncbi:GTPase-activating protein [Terramyces sp. JEL0728]|nr:GTPase-activating protein [Terramyces sp. JEL0728]